MRTHLLLACLLAVSSGLVANAQNPTPPPQQVKFCGLYDGWQKENIAYNNLDAFAKQSAKKPDYSKIEEQQFNILNGPAGTFTNWVGVVSVATSDVNGAASIRFLPCNRTIFSSIQDSRSQVQNYPGGGLHPFKDPAVAALIANPAHHSIGVVSGHLFLLKAHVPQASPFEYVAATADGPVKGVVNPVHGDAFGFVPFLTAFTSIGLPEKK